MSVRFVGDTVARPPTRFDATTPPLTGVPDEPECAHLRIVQEFKRCDENDRLHIMYGMVHVMKPEEVRSLLTTRD